MFQVCLERTMAAHIVSHPFLKASCGLARLVPVVAARCGLDGLWWCGRLGIDGGLCFVGKEVVLCLRDRGSAMRRNGSDFHPKPG